MCYVLRQSISRYQQLWMVKSEVSNSSIASYVENILTSQFVLIQIADRVATAALATREIYAKYARKGNGSCIKYFISRA